MSAAHLPSCDWCARTEWNVIRNEWWCLACGARYEQTFAENGVPVPLVTPIFEARIRVDRAASDATKPEVFPEYIPEAVFVAHADDSGTVRIESLPRAKDANDLEHELLVYAYRLSVKRAAALQVERRGGELHIIIGARGT